MAPSGRQRFTVLDLLQLDLKENDALDLRCICGRPGLVREIEVSEINRPGLELAGFYENFAWQRIQIFGRGENAFLQRLAGEGRRENLEKLFTYRIPCCVFTHSQQPTADFAALAEKAECPVLQTPLSSSEFTMRILRVLSTIFAPRQSVHGSSKRVQDRHRRHSATICPSRMCTTRWAKAATCASWVTSRIETPVFHKSTSTPIISAPVPLSRLPVGSSARRIAGEFMSARAMATR